MATSNPPDLPALTGPPLKPGKYVKLSVHFKKRPDISDEYFFTYWANNHVSAFLAATVSHGNIKGYSQPTTRPRQQHHVTAEMKEMAKGLGMPVLDCDGVSELWAESAEDFKGLFELPEVRKIAADDNPIFSLPPDSVVLGFDHVIWDRREGTKEGME
ncbi:hypothetical protein RB601_005483 [Gaeumannomyces tritici]